jgi:hypothetical protein
MDNHTPVRAGFQPYKQTFTVKLRQVVMHNGEARTSDIEIGGGERHIDEPGDEVTGAITLYLSPAARGLDLIRWAQTGPAQDWPDDCGSRWLVVEPDMEGGPERQDGSR